MKLWGHPQLRNMSWWEKTRFLLGLLLVIPILVITDWRDNRKNDNMTDFQLGDWVSWKHRRPTALVGQIVAVVPAGDSPSTYPKRELTTKYQHLSWLSRASLGRGVPRSTDSYLVAVPVPGGRLPKLYWPKPTWLRLATKPAWAPDLKKETDGESSDLRSE